MAESSLWSYLRKGMKGKWSHATRHEDSVSIGVPDVSYYHCGNNWVELKSISKLPVRATTGINLGQWHKNDGMQRHFLIKRHGWLLVRFLYPIRKYLLFKHYDLPPHEKPYWTATEMLEHAHYIWIRGIDFETMAELLEVT